MADSQVKAPTSAQGADFPVQWERPEDAKLFWTQERMHFPDAVSPLTATFELHSMDVGFNKALSDLGMPLRQLSRVLNGYVYTSMQPVTFDPAEMARMWSHAEEGLKAALMGGDRGWEERLLPELKADIDVFRSFDYAGATDSALAGHVDWVVARGVRHMQIHHLLAPTFVAVSVFTEAYGRISGSADEFEPLALLQGLPNRTVDGGIALWRLSRLAAKSPSVREALELPEPDAVFARLDGTAEGREFARAFRAFLDEFGWRGDSWNLDDRTWADYPKRPLTTLHGYLAQPDEASPEIMHAKLAAEREVAVEKIRSRLAGSSPEERGMFETLLSAAQRANVLQEDHNYYIDQMLQHRSRHAFVEAGKRLVARGRLTAAEDVLYLTVPELQAAIRSSDKSDLRDLVDERRKLHNHQRSIVPPPAIGTPPPPPPADASPNPMEMGLLRFFGGRVEQSADKAEIRGNAGSRGKVTGIARVAMNLEQAAGLRPGEILVCPTTAPPWTPLFATAGAVVTDTGGILSHCAVVAREFGIPAVVGTHAATSRIKTGQRVTVDGSRGIVTIEQ